MHSVFQHPLLQGEHAAGALVQFPAFFRDPQILRVTGEQLHAQFFLQRLDVRADGRLGGIGLFRGLCKTAVVHDSDIGAELFHFHGSVLVFLLEISINA